MKKFASAILLLTLALVGCGSHHKNPVEPSPISAITSLRLVPVDGYNGEGLTRMMAAATGDTTDIYLGEIKKTRMFLFNLQNTGTVPIYGLKIRSTNPAFQISPDSIPVLDVPGDTGGGNLVPIIQVWVGHGTPGLAALSEPLLWDGLGDPSLATVMDTVSFSWDMDNTGGVQYTMTVVAKVVALAADSTVAGNCELRAAQDNSAEADPWSTVEYGGSLPSNFFGIVQNPEGCLPGAHLTNPDRTTATQPELTVNLP